MHEALVTNIPATKRYPISVKVEFDVIFVHRDIYYKDVSLFQKQVVVDRVSQKLNAGFGPSTNA